MGSGVSKNQRTFAPTGDTRDQLANSPSVMFEEDITGSDVYVEPPMTPDKSISLKKDTAAQPQAAEKDTLSPSRPSFGARVKTNKRTKNVSTNPQQSADSEWGEDEESSPQPGKNRTPSLTETPNTHGQSDSRGPASVSSSSSTTSGARKPPGGDAKQGFDFYNANHFRDEKPPPPAPKATLDKQENSPPHMIEDKVQFIPSDPRLTKNLEFYQNRMTSRPRPGHKIEEMLKWRGDYRQLEINHRYIQWLFPIPESSDYTMEAQPLQGHEALTVRKDHQCRSRFLKAYEMMLDFYGMRLVSKATGEVTRCEKNWKKRFAHLNKSGHNYLRITRILKALACFGLAKYQKPWVTFFLNEVFLTKALGEIRHGAVINWIDNMDDSEESSECLRLFQDLHTNTKGIPQSKIRAPVEESDSSESDNENDNDRPFRGDDQDDKGSTKSDQSSEAMQPGKSGMSGASMRSDGKTSTRSNKLRDSSQPDTPGMSKTSSRRSSGQQSPTPRDGKTSTHSDMSAPSRESNEHIQSEYDKRAKSSSSTRSGGQSSRKSRDEIDSRNTDHSASSRESKEYRHRNSSKENVSTNPQQSAYSEWGQVEKSSPQPGKNRTPSLTETPNTHGQSDSRGTASGSSGSSTKSGAPKPSGGDAKQGFDFFNTNDPVAPTDFRDEKPPPPAPKATRDKQENSPPHMMEDKVQFIPSDPRLTKNLEFYQNRMTSRPRPGHKIEEMLKWRGDYRQLEINHRYIQWLFPIPESSDYTMEVQPLQGHEALAVRKDHQCRSRFLKAYEMMLDFYGMRLVSKATGEVTRCEKNWKKRFAHLNKSGHNYLRITRILKALACFGLAKYQKPWVTFFLNEVFLTKALGEIRHGAVINWIDNMDDSEESSECLRLFQDLHANTKGIPQSKIRAPVEESNSSESDNENDINWIDNMDDSEESSECLRLFQDLHANTKGIPQSKIRAPVEESDSSESDNENDTVTTKNKGHGVAGSHPPAAGVNPIDDKTTQSCYVSAREKRRENQIQNLKFYKNELTSKPEPGSTIKDMLRWKGDYKFLEEHGYYIQWLFPIPDTTGMNDEAQPLRTHEIQAIREDKTIQERFLDAYKMMLDLYGIKLKSKKKGTVGHADNWMSRYASLDSSDKPHKQITRIIIALESFGFQHFQQPLVSFLINETFAQRRLTIPVESVHLWICMMADDNEKIACLTTMDELADTYEWRDREEKTDHVGKVKSEHRKPAKTAHSRMQDNKGKGAGRHAKGNAQPEIKTRAT